VATAQQNAKCSELGITSRVEALGKMAAAGNFQRLFPVAGHGDAEGKEVHGCCGTEQRKYRQRKWRQPTQVPVIRKTHGE